MFNYRSPLLDEEFRRLHEQHERGYLLPTPRLRGPPPSWRRPPPGFDPYPRIPPRILPRPSSSNEEAKSYSSRYKLSSYPKELNEKFGALECKLCAVQVTSPITAKMHYSGKSHMKKVKQFLLKWSQETGNPMPKFDEHAPFSSKSSLPDSCKLCDVKFMTTNDKILHFSGKIHRKNELDPANAKKRGKSYTTIDLSNSTDPRFGIGVDFATDSKELITIKPSEFACDICGVKAVSQEQLNVHLSGKKHKEKLRKKEAGIPKPERQYKCEVCNIYLESRYLLNLHLDGKPHAKFLKKMDKEYCGSTCSVCDVTFASYMDYLVHSNGKKHDKKCKQISSETKETIPDQKDLIACKSCPFIGNLDDHECDKSLENLKMETETDKCNWVCNPCFGSKFESEKELVEHKKSRRHLLCMLNIEGDKPDPENIYFYCFTCRKQYNDRTDYTEHLFSHTHMTLSDTDCDLNNRMDLWHCKTCSIVMDKEAQKDHGQSKHHLMLAAQQDLTRTLTDLATQDLGTNTFNCAHCQIDFISFVAFSDHMLDPAHLEDIVCNKLLKVKANAL